jgi:hypothetical protein
MNREKKLKTHKSPYRIRYEEEYPNFTTRMPKEWHSALKNLRKRTGLSNRQIVGNAVGKITFHFDEAIKQGENQGYKKGFSEGKQQKCMEAYERGKQDGIIIGEQQGFSMGYEQCKKDNTRTLRMEAANTSMEVIPGSEEYNLTFRAAYKYFRYMIGMY